MTRLKHAVAALVVISALRRFSDEKFIVRAFHGRGGAPVARNLAAVPRIAQSAMEVRVESNSTIRTNSYVAGRFCDHCTHGTSEALCRERVAYLVQRYRLSEKEALADADVAAKCVAPFIRHKLYAEQDEPIIYLHAGPHKTGTTAMQAFIYENLDILALDNLRVPTYDELPGNFGREGVGLNLAHCSIAGLKRNGGDMNAGMCSRMRKEFPKFVLDAYNKSQNVLIVAEDLDRAGIDFDMLRFFLRPYKRIRAVVTYRRLHDWLPSWYNQIVTQYAHIYAKGEQPFPSFVGWLASEYDKFLDVHAVKVAHRYASYDFVESVHMINMHAVAGPTGLSGKSTIEYFFCHHLRARETCHAIKEDTGHSKSNVGRYDHEYERLAITAKLRGKITADVSGKSYDVTSSLYKATTRLKKRAGDVKKLARICPEEALLKQMLTTESEQEVRHFSTWYEAQGGKEGLRQSFLEARKGKLCSLDMEKILSTGILDDTFAEINHAW